MLLALGACSTTPPVESGAGATRTDSQPAVSPSNDAVTDSVAETIADAGTDGLEDAAPGRDLVKPALKKPTAPVTRLCTEIGGKLSSVSVNDCLRQQLQHSAVSVLSRSLAYKDFAPQDGVRSQGRVLLIGGIHGDEFSSVSVVFKWMDILSQQQPWPLQLRVIPLANPDGLLRSKSQRQNENGVDLNRNFPTVDWASNARNHWVESTASNTRRYPGESSASEPETRWLVDQINEFNPDVIISLHAPHHLVDYDGPPSAPQQVGKLSLRQLGVYPGSLGNYAGHDLQLPIVTLELQSAGIMPATAEIQHMLVDLRQWLQVQLTQQAKIEPR